FRASVARIWPPNRNLFVKPPPTRCVGGITKKWPGQARPQSNTGASVLVGREAVEQAVAAGALEIVLAAAAVRPARGMRRIPRLGLDGLGQAFAVDMAEHRGALVAAGPVAAGAVLAGAERGAGQRRPRE